MHQATVAHVISRAEDILVVVFSFPEPGAHCPRGGRHVPPPTRGNTRPPGTTCRSSLTGVNASSRTRCPARYRCFQGKRPQKTPRPDEHGAYAKVVLRAEGHQGNRLAIGIERGGDPPHNALQPKRNSRSPFQDDRECGIPSRCPWSSSGATMRWVAAFPPDEHDVPVACLIRKVRPAMPPAERTRARSFAAVRAPRHRERPL